MINQRFASFKRPQVVFPQEPLEDVHRCSFLPRRNHVPRSAFQLRLRPAPKETTRTQLPWRRRGRDPHRRSPRSFPSTPRVNRKVKDWHKTLPTSNSPHLFSHVRYYSRGELWFLANLKTVNSESYQPRKHRCRPSLKLARSFKTRAKARTGIKCACALSRAP